jgi:hypothetical protein
MAEEGLCYDFTKKHPLLCLRAPHSTNLMEQLASINHRFLHSSAWAPEERAGVEYGVFHYTRDMCHKIKQNK